MKKILYHPKAGTSGFFLGEFPYRLNMCWREYNIDFEVAKEEAIKNREIKNYELICKGGTNGILFTIDNKQIKDGDIFDLPEVFGFEIKEIPLPEQFASYPGECETFIRLVPSDKEEKCTCLNGLEASNCGNLKCPHGQEPEPTKEEKEPVKEESKFSNSEIGSVHWARTIQSYIMRVGSFLYEHGSSSYDMEIRGWGVGIKERSEEVLKYLESIQRKSK